MHGLSLVPLTICWDIKLTCYSTAILLSFSTPFQVTKHVWTVLVRSLQTPESGSKLHDLISSTLVFKSDCASTMLVFSGIMTSLYGISWNLLNKLYHDAAGRSGKPCSRRLLEATRRTGGIRIAGCNKRGGIGWGASAHYIALPHVRSATW